jgi:hypothetical protein
MSGRAWPLWSLLLAYVAVAFSYYTLCGLVGRAYHPLAAYQVYALSCAAAFAVALWGGRRSGVWPWRRLWPATTSELLAAVASVVT